MKQTDIFQILSDETRLRAVTLMATVGEVCVCELVHALETPQPKISRHMATMRDAGLVVARRDAQWVFYTLATDLAPWQQKVVAAAVEGMNMHDTTDKDQTRLEAMKGRPERCNAA